MKFLQQLFLTFLLMASAKACRNSLVLSASKPATILLGLAAMGRITTKAVKIITLSQK